MEETVSCGEGIPGFSNLDLLCDTAILFEKRYAPKSDTVAKEAQEKSENCTSEKSYPQRVRLSEDNNLSKRKPNDLKNFIDCFEDTSNELQKKFSYKCKKCLHVVRSYGNEDKALDRMKVHFMNCLISNDSSEDVKEKEERIKPVDGTSNSSSRALKRLCSTETGETVSEGRWDRRQSILQGKAIMKESNQGTSNTHLETDDDKNEVSTQEFPKFGLSDHNYGKSEEDLSTVNREVRQNKNQRVKLSSSDKQQLLSLKEEIMKGDELYASPPVVPTAPFPYFYDPGPFEPAQVVEFHHNGNPVDTIRPACVPHMDIVIGNYKKSGNKRKPKFARVVNASRSVLECVDNKVTCKATPEQKDALVPDNSFEDSENLGENDREIALREIRLLSQQKKKRKSGEKISVYSCKICNKHFTANTSLVYHYMGHVNMKPFECQLCMKTFTRRHSLKYHMMIHYDENRFTCEVCTKKFRHPSHFREHKLKHTDEEPFTCSICSNNFKTRNSYKRHLKVQHQKPSTSNDIEPICEDS